MNCFQGVTGRRLDSGGEGQAPQGSEGTDEVCRPGPVLLDAQMHGAASLHQAPGHVADQPVSEAVLARDRARLHQSRRRSLVHVREARRRGRSSIVATTGTENSPPTIDAAWSSCTQPGESLLRRALLASRPLMVMGTRAPVRSLQHPAHLGDEEGVSTGHGVYLLDLRRVTSRPTIELTCVPTAP